jgi:hypothetical protein
VDATPVGIDVSKGKNMVCAMRPLGETVVDFRMTEVCVAFSREPSENASIQAKFCHANFVHTIMLQFTQTSTTRKSPC